jgi:hypothetical protein
MQCCNGSDVIGKGKEGAEKDNGQDRAYTSVLLEKMVACCDWRGRL